MALTETKFLPYGYNTEDRSMIGPGKYSTECTKRYLIEKPILTKELEEWGGKDLVSIEEVIVDYDWKKGLKAIRRINGSS